MALQPRMIACGNSIAAFAMAVRFLTGPAVMAAASIAVGLRGVLLRIAIVQVTKTKSPQPNQKIDWMGHSINGRITFFLLLFLYIFWLVAMEE